MTACSAVGRGGRLEPNCGVVLGIEGQVLAGKYPGAKFDPAAETKIAELLAAGVRTFADLTEDDELLPYAHLLPA